MIFVSDSCILLRMASAIKVVKSVFFLSNEHLMWLQQSQWQSWFKRVIHNHAVMKNLACFHGFSLSDWLWCGDPEAWGCSAIGCEQQVKYWELNTDEAMGCEKDKTNIWGCQTFVMSKWGQQPTNVRTHQAKSKCFHQRLNHNEL